MRLDRADRQAGNFRNLLIAQLLEVEEGYDRPVPGWQAIDKSVHRSLLLLALVRQRRILLLGVETAQLLSSGLLAHAAVSVTLDALQPVHAQVVSDRIEPGGESGISPERADGTPCPQKGLLGHLSGQFVIPHHPQTEVKDVSLVPLDKRLKGRGIAQCSLSRQLLVGNCHNSYLSRLPTNGMPIDDLNAIRVFGQPCIA